MKLLNYVKEGAVRIGAQTEQGIVDLTAALPDPPSELIGLFGQGDSALAAARDAIASASHFIASDAVRILPPVLRPPKFLGVGGNFHSHIVEAAHLGAKVPRYPVWFNKQATCINGPFDPIWKPHDSEELDYEGELALVIGRRCRRVGVEEALSVVAGYAVCNDVSIRDWQMRAPTSTIGKSFDTHGPLGPWLVTPDEVGDPGKLRLRTWVNGDLRQDGTTEEMVFNCAQLVSDLSQRCTLEVGDVLSVGSPAGVGGLRKPPVWLRPGDRVRVEIERVGAIENVVIEEPEAGRA
ncbi:fumarylacetoacetate hydrolase family protein [Variovorax sp. Sphag1AA]|uniref:fumarylacetoacetate hydrolase family protein n=1 Tax=Variovorax sp. Sphag1AA TaxID=2587027 RepID=UPI00161CE75B|nr:fumarylacetoacetate hydrolase family protein [Variovorax sp. Sphag1AA]MBB3177995.1 2-keto-4-pentenoate hydratase/2-oxohepta-3-ene-1,7-dioic acid hydratase in catechol pathway [Variovorax sp. Sphag1AA]